MLGGSRADGTARPDSDWDLGVYYRGPASFDPAAVRDLGHAGYVSALGEWGPIVDGGAWLTVDGTAVDVLFRDLDVVEGWLADAEAGRYAVLDQNGYLVGAPTYLPVGELAGCRHLGGATLPSPGVPGAAGGRRSRPLGGPCVGRAPVRRRARARRRRGGLRRHARRRRAVRGPRPADRAPRVGAQREAPDRAGAASAPSSRCSPGPAGRRRS